MNDIFISPYNPFCEVARETVDGVCTQEQRRIKERETEPETETVLKRR